ncbi:hypothetical protein [uncultured Mediterranea sp.]|nr:hypothetical protein [uncultured Mediterranea sp.]
MTMTQEKIIAIAEENGWYVHIGNNGNNDKVIFEFSKFTPYGQDFNFQAEMVDGDIQTLIDSIRYFLDAFDPDSEAYLWLGPDGHGKKGAPYNMKDIVEDMEAAEDMVLDLCVAYQESDDDE